MSNKLYVGNLPYTTTEADLQAHFEQSGEVLSVKIINDRDTGRSKGYGFIEMIDEEAADAAIEANDGQDFNGRELKVNKARPQERRPQRA